MQKKPSRAGKVAEVSKFLRNSLSLSRDTSGEQTLAFPQHETAGPRPEDAGARPFYDACGR